MPRIYLDHAASSPLRPEAAEAVQRAWQLVGNPSSLHSDGRKAGELLEQCRDKVAKVFACKSNDVVFNSGGSEGDTHALLGAAELINTVRWGAKHYAVAKTPLRIAVSAIEHKAVLHTADKLAAAGHKLSLIPVTRDGVIELDWLHKQIREQGFDLVSVMAVNNEIGTIQPVAEVAELCVAAGAVYHCDAVQVPGHGLSEILQDRTVPLLTISGHKFGGPRGTGVLIQRRELLAQILALPAPVELPALVCGGQQEHGCRAGTENVAGVAGLTAALLKAESIQGQDAALMTAMRLMLETELKAGFQDCHIHGAAAPRAAHVTSFALEGVLGRRLQSALDARGFAVGLGSACTGCDRGVSHVLEAMSVWPSLAEGTLRMSFGWSSDTSEVALLRESLSTFIQHWK